MNTDQTCQQLTQLKLQGMASCYAAIAEQPVHQQILEDRYASGSTIITAQMPVGNRHEYINDPSLADAICDRLTANAHRINLQGSSLRKTKTN